MSHWRILTNTQAEQDYERMELQILQLQTALTYLDQATRASDSRWFLAAAQFARGVRTETADCAVRLSSTPWQAERLESAFRALDARLGCDIYSRMRPAVRSA